MKKALVTGGTKGIGLAITKMLLQEEYFVTITYAKDCTAAQQAAKELAATFDETNFEVLSCDQGNKEDMRQLVHHLQQSSALHCIVFNAGATLRKGIQEFADEEWERVMHINVNSPVFLLRDLFEQIAPQSRIIFIGSEMGVYPHGASLAYGVTKSAVHALSKNLVKFFAEKNTTVNTIAPGFVETEWQKAKPQVIKESICQKVAAQRFATADEVADAVKFVLHNPYVNGSIIEVSGGYAYR